MILVISTWSARSVHHGQLPPSLQRVGRAGHSIGAIPKGRLFPLTRDDLVECTAILDAIQHDELDHIVMQPHPLDVLAQQIIAEVANREWDKSELYNHVQTGLDLSRFNAGKLRCHN